MDKQFNKNCKLSTYINLRTFGQGFTEKLFVDQARNINVKNIFSNQSETECKFIYFFKFDIQSCDIAFKIMHLSRNKY
jgi:hypothetical protein